MKIVHITWSWLYDNVFAGMYKFVHEVHRDTYRVFYCELTGKTLEQTPALPGMLSHGLVSSILLYNYMQKNCTYNSKVFVKL